VDDRAAENYLRDLGRLLRENAAEAKTRLRSSSAAERDFESGRLLGYVEAVSLMQQQAAAFGIELHELSLDGLDPERDLL
jgi:hypothetical protein